MRDEISEIYEELFALDLPAKAWALIAKLHNLNTLHRDHLLADRNSHPDIIAANERRAKDRERKRQPEACSVEIPRNSTESPILLYNNIIPEGGCGGKPQTGIPRKPKDHLKAVVDDERAAAIVEHRLKIKKPLTNRAAMLLAAKLAMAPDPNQAADLMIERGWTGFDPSWLKPNGKDPPNKFVVSERKRSWAEIQAEKKEASK